MKESGWGGKSLRRSNFEAGNSVKAANCVCVGVEGEGILGRAGGGDEH